MSIIKIENSLA